jgi:hypothetical protein
MVINSEFVEREYETLFVQEITKLGGSTWSPGQVQENLLGFDGGIWLPPKFLWQFGFPGNGQTRKRLRDFFHSSSWWRWHFEEFGGTHINSQTVEEWAKFADDFFPPRALNLFVQHKRPAQSTQDDVAGEHWGKAYYEYRIDSHQQERLAKLEGALGQDAVVTYSCAAFLWKRELWQYESENRILANSNFVGPSKLTGHKRYTYVEPGHRGFANADPTPVNDEPFLERLRTAYERSESNFSSLIRQAGQAVTETMTEENLDDAILYRQILDRLAGPESGELSAHPILQNIKKVLAFCAVNSTSWSIVTPPKR